MNAKRMRRIVLKVVLLIAVGVGVFVYLNRHQPVACIPLSDGTELRLEYVTYGTEHRAPGAGRFRAWASGELYDRWPRLGIQPQVAEYHYSLKDPQLLLWFTHFDPRKKEFLFGWPEQVTVYPRDPKVQFGLDEIDRQGGYPMQHRVTAVGQFERRRPSLTLVVRIQGGKTIDLVVANPAAEMQFPEWKAEPMPQRRVGEVELLLRSFKTSLEQYEAVATPIFAARQQGGEHLVLPLGNPDEKAGLTLMDWLISDPTGNMLTYSSVGNRMSPAFDEKVWKVRAGVLRNERYPFANTDGLVLGPVPVPEAGKYHVFPLAKEETEGGLRLAVLLGPGRYVWRDGVFEEVGAGIADAKEAKAFVGAGQRGDNTLRINIVTPTFVVFYLATENARGKKWMNMMWTKGGESVGISIPGEALGRNVVRLQWNGLSLGVRGRHPESWPDMIYDAENSGGIVQEYFFAGQGYPTRGYPYTGEEGFSFVSAYPLPTWDEEHNRPPPPVGAPVTLQLVPVEKETVEFFVAPPKPPEKANGETR
jgi:hypothetical protein